ncbi:MAG: DUF2029 domain-containing protein [Thaumarchaeota archaeon]|nr:DUF2029 domain-containing protein [Nitrososphaerota archaeon]
MKGLLDSLRQPWFVAGKLDPRFKRLLIALSVLALLTLNLRIFLSAYPLMSAGALPEETYSLDFGSYYTAAWRLVHNPAQIYTHGAVNGDYSLGKDPTQFKYLPYFSFFMLPLLLIAYIPALVTWNAFQFLLLPIIALLLYRSLKQVNILAILGVLWIVLLQPLPFPPQFTINLGHFYASQSYHWQWVEGQSKVFVTFLVIASYHFAKNRRPYLAGFLCGLAFFDPRFGLYALPLFLIANRSQLRKFSILTTATLVAGNAILLYDGLASSFLTMVETSGIETSYFDYTWIPFYAIVALTAVEGIVFLRGVWHMKITRASASTFLDAPSP